MNWDGRFDKPAKSDATRIFESLVSEIVGNTDFTQLTSVHSELERSSLPSAVQSTLLGLIEARAVDNVRARFEMLRYASEARTLYEDVKRFPFSDSVHSRLLTAIQKRERYLAGRTEV